MPAERRSDDEIVRELATEREQLAGALAELRVSAAQARKRAVVVGGALAAGLATATAIKIVWSRVRG